MKHPIKFSIIIPVYNRPQEVDELLESLTQQTNKNFEVVIVEDGSSLPCQDIVKKYIDKLDLYYYTKPNTGPGTTRNYGANKAFGDYFVFFDSDCLIPEQYFEIVENELSANLVDAYGGPDAAHPSFTGTQKAISYSMTSFFTTGGIRGGKEKLDKFHPRSFNMGFSRQVFEKTGGYSAMRFGEDVDMSLRILENGFSTKLIKEAFVFHKRRTDFKKFFKQVFNSGIARINLYKRHPKSLKAVHFLPSFFTIGCIFLILLSLLFVLGLIPLALFILIIFSDSLIINKSFKVAFLSVIASFTQLFGYGTGFMVSFWRRIIMRKDEFHAFKKNFYK